MEQKVYRILGDILQIKVDHSTSISMHNTPEWSSIAHIDIIMSLEEEFNILFSEDDLPLLISQEAIISKVSQLVNAQ
ncbi:acyl carrier protein [Helicobacter kayseriensis]|uniref:acyl carrier protein n=1 Tax=Helicobacter kayseriensis TaxID=2905877 RepID=UPI001E4392CF|nr:acyl carrier protein [Helicobacter kayseriensis]MCE3046676.1 acyl carrier protein [Helicobacter kayseriensis]MCE3048022.1 acyl carrier protein [Helicobacter kayseriensis]